MKVYLQFKMALIKKYLIKSWYFTKLKLIKLPVFWLV